MMNETKKISIGHASYFFIGSKSLHSVIFYNITDIKNFFTIFNFNYHLRRSPKTNLDKLAKFMLDNHIAMIFYKLY